MAFDSFDFAIFLPVVFIVYWLMGRHLRLQNVVILVCSYVFYGWWDYRFLGLIMLTTLSSYLCGIQMSRTDSAVRRKVYNVINICVNLLVLGFFKYFNFFVDSMSSLCEGLGIYLTWPVVHIMLPVGISFFTFQALSYTIDVYRRRIDAERSILDFAAYLSFFPQLVAGPIERAECLLTQFKRRRTVTYEQLVDGSRRMLWGFFKKIAVADALAGTVDKIFVGHDSADSLTLVLGAVLYSIQIYADFSGYSDIAIGCARLFGIRLNDNFRYPLFARSIPDFWRRWHISLTQWFRDYVYFPLGGSRCPKWRTMVNTMVVFLLSGLWHGASWKYILWGALHGTMFFPYIMKWLNGKKTDEVSLKWADVMQMLGTFAVVAYVRILVRSTDMASAAEYYTRMWTAGVHGLPTIEKSIIVPIAVMVLMEWRSRRRGHALESLGGRWWMRMSLYYLLIGMMLWFSGQSAQFIYFQF